MKNKALFLDLDGTVIEVKSGNQFPVDKNDWKFKAGVIDAIKRYKDKYFNICIVTNQGGISLGHITREDFTEKIEEITKQIGDEIGQGVNYFFCEDMESYFRKPNPGMAYEFAIKLELSLRESVMVGDMESDAKFAKNAYIGTYLDVSDFIKEDVIR